MSHRPPTGRFVELGDFTPPGLPARQIRAYLPASLHITHPHATLYLLDGQNVFGDHGSFAGGWHAHEAVERLRGPGTWPTAVVALPNAGLRRLQEYGTRVDVFLATLLGELIPRVEAQLGGGGPRLIGGASMGGLAALYAWFHHPQTFDGAMAMSPSLWYNHRSAMRQILRGDWPLPERGRLYVDAGARERGQMFSDAEQLSAVLAGLAPERVMWRPDRRGAHHERHWRRRLPKALRFLLKRQKDR